MRAKPWEPLKRDEFRLNCKAVIHQVPRLPDCNESFDSKAVLIPRRRSGQCEVA